MSDLKVVPQPELPPGARVWWDRQSRRFRWANAWPDDGIGLPCHGACEYKDDAIEACWTEHRTRGEINR